MATRRNSPSWYSSLLIALLFPVAGFAASIATSANCPVTDNHCTCVINGPFYSFRCSSLASVDDFEAVIANSSDSGVILEVDSLKWDFLPLNSLQNSSLRTLIVGNSSFLKISNSSDAPSTVENLHHLSLENVTFHEKPEWEEFSGLQNIQVLFIYNSSIQSVISANFSQHMGKSLEAITIAECNITGIEGHSFRDLKNLTNLRISHNKLRTFSRNILPTPSNLEQLRLDFNRIDSLPAKVFEDMPNLRLVSLSNNKLSTLPQNVFGPLWKPDVHLELRNNPLKCDCRLRWMITSETKPNDIIGQCAFPKPLFGKNIKDLTVEDLSC